MKAMGYRVIQVPHWHWLLDSLTQLAVLPCSALRSLRAAC